MRESLPVTSGWLVKTCREALAKGLSPGREGWSMRGCPGLGWATEPGVLETGGANRRQDTVADASPFRSI